VEILQLPTDSDETGIKCQKSRTPRVAAYPISEPEAETPNTEVLHLNGEANVVNVTMGAPSLVFCVCVWYLSLSLSCCPPFGAYDIRETLCFTSVS
jgi:hypothetical protein